jgi:hypothetical protein
VPRRFGTCGQRREADDEHDGDDDDDAVEDPQPSQRTVAAPGGLGSVSRGEVHTLKIGAIGDKGLRRR